MSFKDKENASYIAAQTIGLYKKTQKLQKSSNVHKTHEI